MKGHNGRNICFYYYGKDHYLINLYKYIKKNMENNIYTLMFIDKNIYELLINNLDDNEKCMLENINIDVLMIETTLDDKECIYKYVDKHRLKIINKGFSNVNLLFDSSEIINKSSYTIYKNIIFNFIEVCMDKSIDILTCYDFEDYINRGKIVTEDIIKISYEKHSYRMFSNEILPIDNFKIDKSIV